MDIGSVYLQYFLTIESFANQIINVNIDNSNRVMSLQNVHCAHNTRVIFTTCLEYDILLELNSN